MIKYSNKKIFCFKFILLILIAIFLCSNVIHSEKFKIKWRHTFDSNIRSLSFSNDEKYIALSTNCIGEDIIEIKSKLFLIDDKGNIKWNKTADFVFDEVKISANNSYIITYHPSTVEDNPWEGNIYLYNINGDIMLSKKSAGYTTLISKSLNTIILFEPGIQMPNFEVFDSLGNLLWSLPPRQIEDLAIWDVALSTDGELIALAGDNTYLYNRTGNLLWKKDFPSNSIAFSDDNSYIAVGGGYDLSLLNNSGNVLSNVKFKDAITIFKFCPKSDKLGIILNKEMVLLNKDGKTLWKYVADKDYKLNFFDSSDEGKYFILTSRNQRIKKGKIICLDSKGKKIWEYILPYYIDEAFISSDGKYIVTGSEELIYFENIIK